MSLGGDRSSAALRTYLGTRAYAASGGLMISVPSELVGRGETTLYGRWVQQPQQSCRR